MVIKLGTNLLGVYVNDGPRPWEIGGKNAFLCEQGEIQLCSR